jgi:predicted NBD/HSP70 family sugar kinase
MKNTGDPQIVKRINRGVLLRLLRSEPGLSRAQLASQSALPPSSVGQLIGELIEEGWVTDVTSDSASGRTSSSLYISVRSRGLIGAELAVDYRRVVAVSLLGEVLWSCEEPLTNTDPNAVCAPLAGLIAQANAALQARGMQLSGIGVGLPGAIDDFSGVVRFAPNLGWRNVKWSPLLIDALYQAGLPRVPVYIQNEADTAALSEYEFSEGDRPDSLIFVNCGIGVGAGIVLNDRLFTGTNGMAGEIGHNILQLNGTLCSCGRLGCFEAYIGSRAIQPDSVSSLQDAGHDLGVLMQNLWTTFDPSVLVVGGSSCMHYPDLVQAASATLQLYALSAGVSAPQLRLARYGLQAAAVGAAALVLHRLFRPTTQRAHHVSMVEPASPDELF